jgi:hypothetical protein
MAKPPTKDEPKGQWPSLEQQLAAARAEPGSAFEKFIRLNQEFELLRPGETQGDVIRLPPWLRVYWRKQHPDESHAPAGPAGDYPESLNRTQEWMQVNQQLAPDPEKWLSASERKPPRGKHGN